jgi:hypothetical protein
MRMFKGPKCSFNRGTCVLADIQLCTSHNSCFFASKHSQTRRNTLKTRPTTTKTTKYGPKKPKHNRFTKIHPKLPTSEPPIPHLQHKLSRITGTKRQISPNKIQSTNISTETKKYFLSSSKRSKPTNWLHPKSLKVLIFQLFKRD